jgi:tetratricopeptide (TPR) repeat protein
MDSHKAVDPWSHFVNNFVIDKEGNRIARRNPQDIFTTAYNHQIPPGAGQIAHYRLQVPDDVQEAIKVEVSLKYRKFAQDYIQYMNESYKNGDNGFTNGGTNADNINNLPVTVICEDVVVLPVQRRDGSVASTDFDNAKDSPELWQRWNDYGIALLLTGNTHLKQAAEAFAQVENLGRFDGPLNMARVLFAEGNLNAATEALQRAEKMNPPPPPWTFAWLSGEIAFQQGQFELAEKLFRSVLYDQTSERTERKFDFSKDYIVRLSYGTVLVDLAEKASLRGKKDQALEYLNKARQEFESVIDDQVDPDNNTAYANLRDIYRRLAAYTNDSKEIAELEQKSKQMETFNQRFKPDDNAADIAIPKARMKYPALDHAAEKIVIYDLHRNQNSASSSDQSNQSSPPESLNGDLSWLREVP